MNLFQKLPLLALRLEGKNDVRLCFPSLSSPHRSSEHEELWYISQETALFCRHLKGESESIFLIGWFPRSHDRLYYWIQENITLATIDGILGNSRQLLYDAASLLQLEGETMLSLSYLASVILESDSPARALLAPLSEPALATAHLIRLAQSEPSLLLPIALLMQVAVADELGIADLRIPVAEGKASLYFLAARCLERAMEEDAHNPLLPLLTEAFVRLAEEIGDHTGVTHYTAFLSENHSTAVRSWNSLPGVSHETVRLLVSLAQNEWGAADELLDAIGNLPICFSPTEGALLWSGVLWGVLGFIPKREGFTLAPLAVKKDVSFCLSYQGKWRIKLSPDLPPVCSPTDQISSEKPCTEEKIFRTANISRQNRCISMKDSVK
jgi:hypothetical protein